MNSCEQTYANARRGGGNCDMLLSRAMLATLRAEIEVRADSCNSRRHMQVLMPKHGRLAVEDARAAQ